jgi:hypothetical protein
MSSTEIRTTCRKCVILPTENTNRLAEELGYNIAGRIFIVGGTEPDGTLRGYIKDGDVLRGVYRLNADDVA